MSKFEPVAGPMEVGKILTESGNGAQGIVYGAPKAGGQYGHVWNAVNQGGTIRFLDSQVIRSGVNNASVGLSNFDKFQDFQFMLTRPGTPP